MHKDIDYYELQHAKINQKMLVVVIPKEGLVGRALPILLLVYSGKKKATFRPETGPEFPQNDKDLPHINRKKYFACFRAESFFF